MKFCLSRCAKECRTFPLDIAPGHLPLRTIPIRTFPVPFSAGIAHSPLLSVCQCELPTTRYKRADLPSSPNVLLLLILRQSPINLVKIVYTDKAPGNVGVLCLQKKAGNVLMGNYPGEGKMSGGKCLSPVRKTVRRDTNVDALLHGLEACNELGSGTRLLRQTVNQLR